MKLSRIFWQCAILIGLSSGLGACAKSADRLASDPYENYNRKMYAFNKNLDKVTLKPVARVYNELIPLPMRYFIGNFFRNLSEISTIANDLLQLKIHQAAHDTLRFSINSTLGLGGLFDVATPLQIPAHQQDLGLSLAYWGYRHSAYLVLPILGPSTVRDGFGTIGTYYTSAWPYVHARNHRKLYAAGLEITDHRASLFPAERLMRAAAADEYVFVRDAYLQRRAALMHAPRDSVSSQASTSIEEDLGGPPL